MHEQYAKHGPGNQPPAALLRDLKQRGLLEDTLVVWCEFGRMPTFQKGPVAATTIPTASLGLPVLASSAVTHTVQRFVWLEGGQNISTVYDLHATILHLLGLDHERLTFYHNGFERRLTDVHGHVIHDVLS